MMSFGLAVFALIVSQSGAGRVTSEDLSDVSFELNSRVFFTRPGNAAASLPEFNPTRGHQTGKGQSLPGNGSLTCKGHSDGTPFNDKAKIPTESEYATELKNLNINAVFEDIRDLLTRSDPCWPADVHDGIANYGPFFVRLAWHCSGSFRATDGKGGCAGGRMRFEPERSWADNANLDKARALLAPIKLKYGVGLSWGDLFVAAGTTAIRSMGGPITQMCFGRIDDADGSKSSPLGPSAEQEDSCPRDQQGKCKKPLGTKTVGLIYVNPVGPMDEPDPIGSAAEIRDVFGRMGHSDRGTVALIGGGHAFGKAHGACAIQGGGGDPPIKAFRDGPGAVWQGKCGNGVGKNTVTSGFEGYWTTRPFKWDNDFFKNLLERKWEKVKGPGGKWQWKPHSADAGKPIEDGTFMMTSDIALTKDPQYLAIAKEFASNIEALNHAFDTAWTSLTHRPYPTGQGKTAGWSEARRCDVGSFPVPMLNTDSGGR